MSSEGEKKAKLGFSKYRLLLWLVILGAACGLFVKEFDAVGIDRAWYSYEYIPYNGSKRNVHSSPEAPFLFIYSREDNKEAANEEAKLRYERRMRAHKSSIKYSSYEKYDSKQSLKGIKYRDGENIGKSIFNGLIIPFLLIVLTILFERPIVRKLKKMNE